MEQAKHSFEKVNKRDELKDAVERGDLADTLRILEELNNVLIGERGTYDLSDEYRADIEKLLSSSDGTAKVHLGDGGLSRLIIEKEEGSVNMFLGATSTEKVKQKWEGL